jgi:predicted Zn-dependent peptidase
MYEEPALSRPVIGSPETVAAITPATLRAFYRKHYNASDCVMVIAGDFKKKELLGILRREFESMPKGDARVRMMPPVVGGNLRQVAVRKPVKQTYLAFGFPTPPGENPDHEALDLLAGILADGRNSRLVHHLRENKQLVWSISAANLTHQGPGLCHFRRSRQSKK